MAVSEAPRVTEAAALLAGDDERWREFLLAHPDALPYHHPAWVAALAEAYGYEPLAAVVRSATGEIVGGLPFVEVGGRLRSRRWISLPFTDVRPPLTSAALGSRAREASRSSAGSARSGRRIRAPLAGFEERGEIRGVRHELELGDPEALFAAFKPQVRRNIRKAEKVGLQVRDAERRDDLVRTYFDLHADTRRRLGVRPQPRRFFDSLWRNVVDHGLGFVLLAYHEHVPVAGAVFLEWNGRMVYKYGASDQEHWALRPNNLLFWECIRLGASSGARTLDSAAATSRMKVCARSRRAGAQSRARSPTPASGGSDSTPRQVQAASSCGPCSAPALAGSAGW